MTPLPLAGVTVVSIEQAVATPFATRQLADLGARVIKIERPGEGDFARGYDSLVKGQAAYFVWLNRTKESLTLNLRHPDSLNVLSRLLKSADVFVQNMAPGSAESMGLGSRRLRDLNSRLIVCNVTGYGSSGPYSNKRAYDLLVQSEVGLVSITGTESDPSRVGVSIADISAGMYAYSGILSALLSRQKTGEGTALEVSLFDSLGEWMGQPMYVVAYGGDVRRTGANHSLIAPYGPFSSKEGDRVVLGIQNDREWKRLCSEVLANPELGIDPRFLTNQLRVQHREQLHSYITSVFEQLSTTEVIGLLDSAQIANARINTVKQFLEHPQTQERDVWREISSPGRTIRAMLPPARMEGVEQAMGAVPGIGEHSESILREFGFEQPAISKWKNEGMI
jgi:itaconate CoA-transferase